MNQSSEIKDLFTALSKAQSQIRGALKDSSNPFFKSKYADLESVWEACRAALTANGLSVIQTTDYDAVAGICVVTTLGHNSGQWIKGTLPIMAKAQDPQGIGSAITYSRRYSLAAIVGVVQVDDDGEGGMGRDKTPPSDKTQTPSGMPIIRPEQPPEGMGTTDTSYRIPFGKFARRSLEEVGPKDLRSYVAYLESQAEKKGEKIQGTVADFISRATAYVVAFEEAPI